MVLLPKNDVVLSARAWRLMDRIRAGRFYYPYDDRLPAAIEELEAAKMVETRFRITQIKLAYVPTSGYVPFQGERFEVS